LLKYCLTKKLNVHYCTAKLKDKVQLTKRIKHRAKNVCQEYDTLTKEGTLIRGAIYTQEMYPSMGYAKRLAKLPADEKRELIKKIKLLKNKLIKKYKIPAGLIDVDEQRIRLLTTGAVIEELLSELKRKGFQPAIVEEYPTWDALIVDLELL
ncbi:MAG: hypothetical protein KJ574_05400, partial [Nanoarchaeota archaeon]|nr:hypothetical protein [Nanoarchaeota archaeon]